MAFTEFELGLREQTGWIVETSWGAGGTMSSGEVIGRDVRIEPAWTQGVQESLSSGADDRTVSLVAGPKSLPYAMSFIPVSWRWLKYLMAVSDGDDGGVKTHTFTIPDTITSSKIEWGRRSATDDVITLSGNCMKSATLSWTASSSPGRDGFILVAADMVAKTQAQGSSVTSLSAITASREVWY